MNIQSNILFDEKILELLIILAKILHITRKS